MAALTATPQLRETTGGWVSSPRWDLFWMFSALWGCAACYLLGVGVGHAEVGALLFVGNWLIAIAHSFSTTWVVLGSPLLREARQRNRRKFTVVPILVVSGSLLLGLAIGLTDGFPRTVPFTGTQSLWITYTLLFWVGHFWHFGNQDFGVLSIYRVKAGQLGGRDRKVDKAYCVAMMFVIQPVVYLKAVSGSPFSDVVFSVVPVSHEFVAIAATVGVASALAMTLGIVAYELRKHDASVPKLLYYAVMLAHPLFLYLVQWRLGFYYLIVYFWSHWFIAIGLVGRINANHYRERGASPLRALGAHLLTFGTVAGGAALFHLFFGSYAVFSGKRYREVLSVVLPEYAWIVGLILGVFLAEQLLHYYCDRCLFRFRDGDVRRAVSPLL